METKIVSQLLAVIPGNKQYNKFHSKKGFVKQTNLYKVIKHKNFNKQRFLFLLFSITLYKV